MPCFPKMFVGCCDVLYAVQPLEKAEVVFVGAPSRRQGRSAAARNPDKFMSVTDATTFDEVQFPVKKVTGAANAKRRRGSAVAASSSFSCSQ